MMKYLYFADIAGDIEDERVYIENLLHRSVSKTISVAATDLPPWDKIDFDVLFFDWGGMSTGNSMLEHFCKYIIEHAREHPNKLYVMMSQFTSEAMKECQEELSREHEKYANIFLDIDSALSLIKAWEGARS